MREATRQIGPPPISREGGADNFEAATLSLIVGFFKNLPDFKPFVTSPFILCVTAMRQPILTGFCEGALSG